MKEVAFSPLSTGLCGRHTFRMGGLWEALLGRRETNSVYMKRTINDEDGCGRLFNAFQDMLTSVSGGSLIVDSAPARRSEQMAHDGWEGLVVKDCQAPVSSLLPRQATHQAEDQRWIDTVD